MIAGCGVAVYRNGQSGDVNDRDRQTEDVIRSITSDFSSGSGALSMTRLGTGYDRIEIKDGRTAMIQVQTMGGDGITLYIPDLDTFESMNGEDTSIRSRFLPVSTDDGMVVPGRLEVTIIG